MNTSGAIGVFDSGLGGLSILKELQQLLPDESFMYVADSGHAPYGSKSRAFILERSRRITRFLLQNGCKMVVVACNTATGAAISALREEFSVPFIGVEPAIKPAAEESHTGHIGVLATQQTFQGEHFQRTAGIFSKQVEVHVQPGDGLVELIEEGMTKPDLIREILQSYLLPLIDLNIDQLVLGCTHYPFLIPMIEGILPSSITIHDPAPAVARYALKVLEDNGMKQEEGAKAVFTYYTSGDIEILRRFIRSINLVVR